MGTVFISYRRGDSSGHTGRLFDRLEQRFGRDAFFRDLESLEYGIDFPREVEKALAACRIVLVVIGPGWLNARTNSGQRRLDQPQDFVRIEVAAALARSDVRTIPVLVGDAEVPSEDELPDGLKPLASRNGLEVSDSRWDYDVNKLGDALVRAGLGDQRSSTAPVSTTPVSTAPVSTTPVSTAPVSTTPASAPAVAPNKRGFGKRAVFGFAALGAVGIVAFAAASSGGADDHSKETQGENQASPPPEQKEEIPDGPREPSDKGLVWMKRPWHRSHQSWNDAVAYCKVQGPGWRLPTIAELRTIPDERAKELIDERQYVVWSAEKDGEDSWFYYALEDRRPISINRTEITDDTAIRALCVSSPQ